MKTSDVSNPTYLDVYDAASDGSKPFDRSILQLRTYQEGRDYLRVMINEHTFGFLSSFLMYSSNGLPAKEKDVPHDPKDDAVPPRTITGFKNTLTVTYSRTPDGFTPGFGGEDMPRDLLTTDLGLDFVEAHHPLHDAWNAPFFYEDGRYAFYVNTSEQITRLQNYSNYGISSLRRTQQTLAIPKLIVPDPTIRSGRQRLLPSASLPGGLFGIGDPAPIRRFVTEDAYISKGIGNVGTVVYGGSRIGPAGAIVAEGEDS
jgi:hypothetical protein